MITDPSSFDRKQYRFLFETGFARANRFFGPLASFSGFFGFIAVANFVAGLILGEYVHILAGDPEIVIVQSLLWATPGLISNFLVLFFIPYLGDIVIDMAKTVSPYLANINLRSYFSTFFRSQNQLFFAILFGSAASFFQIRGLIISPGTDWAHLYVVSYWVTLALATVVIFGTTLTYFLISLLFYQCVASGYIVYRVGKSLRQDIGTRETESTDLQWLGRVGLGASIAWMVSVGVILLQALVAPVAWWSILQVMLFAASCIAIFVLPFTSSHKALSNIKSRALSDIRTRTGKGTRRPRTLDQMLKLVWR